MAITRTALGTKKAAALGTELRLNNITMPAGSCLVVGVVFPPGADAPVVTFGGRPVPKRIERLATGPGIGTSLHVRVNFKRSGTQDIVATWASDTGKRAMFATRIDGANLMDVKAGNIDGIATHAPRTSKSGKTSEHDLIAIAAFGSNGPLSDAPGTPLEDFVSGQRQGTDTGTNDRTIQETYKIFSAQQQEIEAKLTGATERQWASVLVGIKENLVFNLPLADDVQICSQCGSEFNPMTGAGYFLADFVDTESATEDYFDTLDCLRDFVT